jgi:energy-coupling factor transporter ATP-binding protein EcfA2
MIKLESLSLSYTNTDELVLRRVNLDIAAGELILVSGSTGSGKSSLLKAINGLAPHFTGGILSGRVSLNGLDVTGQSPRSVAHVVGYVNQQPEGSFATDSVEDELVFGLEQLGWEPSEMATRVDELITQFALEGMLHLPLVELSGGQQQRVAIASALAARQKVLLLDEPTSALDNASAAALLDLLTDLARNHGITVMLAEHRIDRLLQRVDRVIRVNGDGSIDDLAPDDASLKVSSSFDPLKSEPLAGFTPAGVLFEGLGLSKTYGSRVALAPMNLKIGAGSISAAVGDNGSGKTSLLWCVLREAWKQGLDVAMVPQNAADLLFLSSVSDELTEAELFNPNPDVRAATRFENLVGRVDPSMHPRDLSAGQQLALVLAIQLSKEAKLVILDEPTRGLDGKARWMLAKSLIELKALGHGVLLATHDSDFADQIADQVIHLSQGQLNVNVADHG